MEMEPTEPAESIGQVAVVGGGRGGRDGGGELVERLPQALLFHILSLLDVQSLYAVAPVCRAFRTTVSQVLSFFSVLDLSGFTPTEHILSKIMSDNCYLQSLTLDCSRLNESSIKLFAKKYIEELVLLKFFCFAENIFREIGSSCSNLRVFTLEMASGEKSLLFFDWAIKKFFKGCGRLESLSLKFKGVNPLTFNTFAFHLPKTIKTLLLQPVSNRRAMELVLSTQLGIGKSLPSESSLLQSLTLVVNYISDELVATIIGCLHHLTDLCLEDDPPDQLSLHNDLSNTGLQSLGSSGTLTRLSLSRKWPDSFRRVTDVGVLVLVEGCKSLESVKLGGFSKVTDAGYISILQSFKNLKRFEITNGCFLSDLAFHDICSVAESLVKVVLISCNLLTCETAESLSSCKSLEVLNLGGCRSIANHGLQSISKLCNLTLLDLSGADITDSGLSALGLCISPIDTLRLRGCKRIGDRGFKKLLKAGSVITRTLSTLDLGCLPGLSDEAITWIAKMCWAISSLCIRNCFSITDASMMKLGLMEDIDGKRRSIKALDLYNCSGLSVDSFKLFYHPYFCGLQWLGFGNTKLPERGIAVEELRRRRPLLNMCVYGCEMGCKDGWFLH